MAAADVDGDGRISYDEFAQAIAGERIQPTAASQPRTHTVVQCSAVQCSAECTVALSVCLCCVSVCVSVSLCLYPWVWSGLWSGLWSVPVLSCFRLVSPPHVLHSAVAVRY